MLDTPVHASGAERGRTEIPGRAGGSGRVPVTKVAGRYGVSRQSVHSWLRCYEQNGLGALADRSRRPGSSEQANRSGRYLLAPVLDHFIVFDADTVNRCTHPPLTRFVCPMPARMALSLVGPNGLNADYLDAQLWE